MRRRSILPLTTTLCVVALVGCSGNASGGTADDIAQWRAQAGTDDGDVLAVLEGAVDRGEGAGDPEVSVSFEDPVTIDEVELACSGDGSLEGRIGLTSAQGAVDTTSDRVSCAEGVHVLDLRGPSREAVTRVTFSALESTEDGAWRVVVR